jgi:hypothetical protein
VSTDRETTRAVRSWLDEGITRLPDRVLDAVLDQVPATPQRRRPWWPARRSIQMNTFAKLAGAAAALLVVAVVGYQLLPATSQGPGPTVTPVPTPTPTAQPAPSPTAAAFPNGPIGPGTYGASRDGVALTFRVPTSGWTAGDGIWVSKGTVVASFWIGAFDNIYADPCAHTPFEPAPARTPAALAAAVASIQGVRVVSGPEAFRMDGYPAYHVTVEIPADLPCEPHEFYLYYDDETGGPSGGYRYANAPLDLVRCFIVDVGGTIVWIDGDSGNGAPDAAVGELGQIIDSIEFTKDDASG